MSWSSGDSASNLDALRKQLVERYPEAEDQIEAAITAAQAIVASGAVGPEESLYVHLAGHANPDHAPRAGYANDTVAVTVTRI